MSGNPPRMVGLALLAIAVVCGAYGALGMMGIDPLASSDSYLQDTYYVVRWGRFLVGTMAVAIGNLTAALWLVWRPKARTGFAGAAMWAVLAANALLLAALLLPSLYAALFVNLRRYADIDKHVAAEMTRGWGMLLALGLILLGWFAWLAAWLAGRPRGAE